MSEWWVSEQLLATAGHPKPAKKALPCPELGRMKTSSVITLLGVASQGDGHHAFQGGDGFILVRVTCRPFCVRFFFFFFFGLFVRSGGKGQS